MQGRSGERAGLGFTRKGGAEIDSVGDGLPDAYQQAKCPRAKCIFALPRLRNLRLSEDLQEEGQDRAPCRLCVML